MDEFESTADRRPPSFTSDDAALGFDIEELDDKEFNLPPVENPPTLESILNEVEDSVSDEEVLSHAGPFGACDSASVGSTDSRDRSSSSSRTDSGIMRHVVLRGVSAQLRSAAERVHSGKPTAMAVSAMIAVGTFHGLVLVFDAEQALRWCLGSTQLGEQYGSVSALGFNRDCSRLLCGYAKGQLTMWDLTSGRLLRTITDIHPPQMAILHAKFTDDPTLGVCSDSGGSVYELSFRKLLNSRTCDSVCIFSGSRGEVCALEPLHVSPEVSPRHPAQEVSLLALATVTKVIVVTVRPVLRVRFTHALRARPDTLPLLGWQFVVIQVSSSARIVDPVLAFGRQSTLFFFQVSVAGPDQVLFVPLQKVHVPYPVQAFTWLNSRTLATLDTAENLHVLDVRSQEELEVLDMSDVQLVYGTSHFRGHATGGNVSQAMAAAAERACYHSAVAGGAQLLLLGVQSVHVVSLRPWQERLSLLWARGLRAEALRLARALYRDEAHAVVGLVGRRERRQQQVAPHARRLLREEASRGDPATLPLCVQLALELGDPLDELCSGGAFLDALPPYVLEGRLRCPSPVLAKALVERLAASGQLELLERCIVCLDVACLDLHQVMTLCRSHGLYDGIIYVHTRAMNDYIAPIQELMATLREALQSGKPLTDGQVLLGNKLLVYISCCLAGRAYPRGELAVDQAPSVKRDVFHCISALRPLDDDQGDTFPYLRVLLRFNTCEFLNVLALALEEPEFAATEAGLAQKQRLVDILLQVVVQGQGYSPAQVGALFTFVARQLARPGGGLVVERLLLDQVLECLCQPPGGEGEEEARREERQQALLELLQAGALADVEPRRLLHLARQARFYRVCEQLYAEQRQFAQVFLCRLEDPSRRAGSFEYAARVLSSPEVSEQEKEQLEAQLVDSLEALLQLDGQRASQLLVQRLAHRVDELLHRLQGQPRVLYHFLQAIGSSGREGLSPEVQEKYIELMCQFEPAAAVRAFLDSSEGNYRLEETLQICRRHSVREAVAYLLEKAGDVHGALDILLQLLGERLRAGEAAAEHLQAAVQLCQRSSPPLSPAEREALWFPLLELLLGPPHDAAGAGASGAADALTQQLLAGMAGFVGLARILQRLLQDPGYRRARFGQVRHFVVKMLDSHNYEKALLHTTRRLLGTDVHLQLGALRAAANRAYGSHSATCAACGHGLGPAAARGVLLFRCGHCYHQGACLEGPRRCPRCCSDGHPADVRAASSARSLPLHSPLLKSNLQLALAPARLPGAELDI